MATPLLADHEHELVDLLNELSEVQEDLFEFLRQKRQAMLQADRERLEGQLLATEQRLVERLERCHARRQQLLEELRAGGASVTSLKHLAQLLDGPGGRERAARVEMASHRMRLLQHESLTNWVVAQRTLLHLTQLLEILANGGRQRPTYGNGASALGRGAMVDREV
jgi:hypothetical protein